MRSRDIKRRHGLRLRRSRARLPFMAPTFRVPRLRALPIRLPALFKRLPPIYLPKRPGKPKRRRPALPFKATLVRLCALAAVAVILVFAWRLLRPGVRIRVSPHTVAAFRVPHRAIGLLEDLSQAHGVPFPELFALFLAENNFFPQPAPAFDYSRLEVSYAANFDRLLRRYNSQSLAPYIDMFRHLFREIEVFPIPGGWYDHEPSVMFGNTWGYHFHGNRPHMGTAIMDRENIRGRVPVVSMTAGQVTDSGWDNRLGYFVEITAGSGNRYVYAHLDSIVAGVAAGQHMTAGQPLGQMGNSGGRGSQNFPVHLHIAIGPRVAFARGDFWINPYPLLRHLENRANL